MSDPKSDPKKTIEISEAARSEMESICRRATAGEDVEPAVRDELYAHLEDKLIGYLSGEERITEADAMILVREHFGRPEALRPILSYVHAEPEVSGPPLWRRIVAAAVVLSAATVAVSILHCALVLAPAAWAINRGNDFRWLSTAYWASGIASTLATTAILYVAMRRWRSPEAIANSWISRWELPAFGLAFVALLLGNFATGQLTFLIHRSIDVSAGMVSRQYAPQWIELLLGVLSLAVAGLMCLVWIAWIAGLGRRRRSWWMPVVAACAWVLYFPVWNAALHAFRLILPDRWSVDLNPWSHVYEAMFASIVAGPALALYLTPAAYRWLKNRSPLRVVWGQ